MGYVPDTCTAMSRVHRHRDGVAEVTDESFVSESEGVCDGGEAVAGTAPTATGKQRRIRCG